MGQHRATPLLIESPGVTCLGATLPHSGSATLVMWFPLGSRHEPAGRSGLSHLCEHLLTRTIIPGGREAAFEVENRGGEIAAYQYKDGIRVSIRLPDRDRELGPVIFRAMLTASDWPSSVVQGQVAAICHELREQNDWVELSTFLSAVDALWPDPDWRRPVGGREREISELTVNDVRGALADARRRRLLIGLVSADSAADNAGFIADRLGDLWPTSSQFVPPAPTVAPLATIVRDHRPGMAQAYLSLATAAPPRADALFPALELADVTLAGGANALVTRTLQDRHLAYGIMSDVDVGFDLNSYSLTFGTDGNQISEALAAAIDAIEQVRSGRVPADELERIRRRAEGRLSLELDNPELCARWLALECICHGHGVAPADREQAWLEASPGDLGRAIQPHRATSLVVVGDVPDAGWARAVDLVQSWSGMTPVVLEPDSGD